MDAVKVWVPLEHDWLPDTNAALALLYGFAYSAGIAKAHSQRVLNVNRYNEHARIVRHCTKHAASALRVPPMTVVCDVFMEWKGFDLWDADAWAIPAKWIIDGLRDAHVFKNDRTMIRRVAGEVVRGVSPSGVLIRICEVEHA